MSELTEQLDKMIQKAALDGALTNKAVDQFHSLVKQNEAMEEKAIKLEQSLMDAEKQITKLDADNSELRSLQGHMAQRENEVSEREKKMTTLELTVEFQEHRVNDHKKMVELIFRNSVLRREVMTPTHPSAPDQYGTRQEGYPSKDTVEEEEN